MVGECGVVGCTSGFILIFWIGIRDPAVKKRGETMYKWVVNARTKDKGI